MLIIPTGTDAPIYHRPFATVGLIALSIALFLAVPPHPSEALLDENDEVSGVVHSTFDRYALTLGDGMHPVQWVAHNFLHYGPLHLAGNVVFLWAFGIVVEGKLGALKYLATYLAVGTLHGALVQALLLRSGLEGNAAGASAVVFGLLAICMLWAPRNELSCVAILSIGLRILVFHWDLYYTTVALLYIGEQVVWLAVRGLVGGALVSELGHLSGASWGAVLAVAFLKAGWVDCEGWDLFSLAAGRRKLAREVGQAHRGPRTQEGEPQEEHQEGCTARARRGARTACGRCGPARPEADRRGRHRRGARGVRQGGSIAVQLADAGRAPCPDQGHARPWRRGRLDPTDARPLPPVPRRLDPDPAEAGAGPDPRPAAPRRRPPRPGGDPPRLAPSARQGLARQAARMRAEGLLELEGDD